MAFPFLNWLNPKPPTPPKTMKISEVVKILDNPYVVQNGVEQTLADWTDNNLQFLKYLATLTVNSYVSTSMWKDWYPLDDSQVDQILTQFCQSGILRKEDNGDYRLAVNIEHDRLAKRRHISCYNLHEFFDNGIFYHTCVETYDDLDFVTPREDRVGIALDVNGLSQHDPNGTICTAFLYHPKLGWSNTSIEIVTPNSHPDKYTQYGNKEGDIEYTKMWNSRMDNPPKNSSCIKFDYSATTTCQKILFYLSDLSVNKTVEFDDVVKATGVSAADLTSVLTDLRRNAIISLDGGANRFTLLANVTADNITFPLSNKEQPMNDKTMPRSAILSQRGDFAKDPKYVIALDHTLDYIQTLAVGQLVDFEQLSEWYSIDSATLAKLVHGLGVSEAIERDVVNGYYSLSMRVVDDRPATCADGKPTRNPLDKYNLHQLFDAMGNLGVTFHSPIKDESDLLHPPKDNVMGIAPDVGKFNPVELTVHPTYFLYTPELGWSDYSVEIMQSHLHPNSYTDYGNFDGHVEYRAYYDLKQERINFIVKHLCVERQVAYQIVSRDKDGSVFNKLFQQLRLPTDSDTLRYPSKSTNVDSESFANSAATSDDTTTVTKLHFRRLVTLYQEETDCKLSEVANRIGLTLAGIRELIS
jgi:hypothetical protein